MLAIRRNPLIVELRCGQSCMMKCDGSQREALRLADTLGGVRYSNLACLLFRKQRFIMRAGLITLAVTHLIIIKFTAIVWIITACIQMIRCYVR